MAEKKTKQEEKKQPQEEEVNLDVIKQDLERLKQDLERLKLKTIERTPGEMIKKETVIKVLDETENIVKKTFAVIEGAIIGAIEGAKKNLK
ncbi:ATP-dependent protease [Persephonella sp.]|uniref:ATP-dependent protease n=1 Tax=Persephonella sp. TaxID=2060922 RepID=UPI0026271057|nr:ATP-dependent protease [Persephonella sp.]